MEEELKNDLVGISITHPYFSGIVENALNYIEKLEKENNYLSEQNMMMSERHFNDSNKIKVLDKAITYMLQDLEVEKKGFTIEEMKNAYLTRAKSEGIFIKKETV